MRGADSVWPVTAMAMALLSLVLTACGSGDLGQVVGNVSAIPPHGDVPAGVIDAGSTHAGVCGDGVLQTARGEECDGTDFGGRTCMDLMLGDGVLGCDASTCRLLTSQCMPDAGKPPPALDSGDASAADTGVQVPPPVCPSGFACGTSIVEPTQSLCMQRGAATPPLCFQAGSDAECTAQLAGSMCTNTSLGEFCLRPCSP